MPSTRKPATKPAYAATDAAPDAESLFAGAPSGAQGLAGVVGAEYDPEKLPDGVAAKIVKVRPDVYPPTKSKTKWAKDPTPNSEWDRRSWKPRKREPGERGIRRNLAALEAISRKLCVPPSVLDALPRRPDGAPAKSPELRAALQAFVAAGGTMQLFGEAVGLSRSTLNEWIRRDPEWSEDYEAAKKLGADALIEEALEISENPKIVEEVFLSFDGKGQLKRKDVRRADAIYARKLAVATRLDIAKKWAPEKYGDKLEVKTDESLASRIIAARQRTRSAEPIEDIEVKS